MISLGLILIFISLILFFISFFIVSLSIPLKLTKQTLKSFAILIPARNESKVIESLLTSIESQTVKVNPRDVYIIIEDKTDPTITIAKKHQMNIIYRTDLTLKRKGYALDDAIKYILKKKLKYDAYFIIDADNILDENFFMHLINDYNSGYDISVGKRVNKDSTSIVASSSILIFSLLNNLNNNHKIKHGNTVTLSGTGIYIKGEILESLKSFPFHTMTEDYELSLYATLNNLTTHYCQNAIIYDEQPTSFKTSIIERTRWIYGFFETRHKYIKKILKSINLKDRLLSSKINALIGINYLIILIIGLLFITIGVFISYGLSSFLIYLLFSIITIYLILFILSLYLIHKEGNTLNITKNKLLLALFNPIFLLSFIISAIRLINPNNITWNPIPHKTRKVK